MASRICTNKYIVPNYFLSYIAEKQENWNRNSGIKIWILNRNEDVGLEIGISIDFYICNNTLR